jgi:bifunctional non-homologous end joining protein LigD
VLSDHTDEDGATIFRQACMVGLEGIVSKRLTAPYRSGPSRDWLKVKNPDSPAMIRAREADGNDCTSAAGGSAECRSAAPRDRLS